MKKISLLGLIAVLAILLGVPAVYATILYDNGAPNQVSGNEMTQWIQAEQFTLPTAQTINEVKFWGFPYGGGTGYTGSITYFIYDNNSGSPGSILASGNLAVTAVSTGMNYLGSPEVVLDFTIPAFTAAAGTEYWLGLHNGPTTTTTRNDFYWETTNANTTPSANEFDLTTTTGGPWLDNGQEHAFQLLGGVSVPEPSVILLLGSGLIGLVGLRKKLRR